MLELFGKIRDLIRADRADDAVQAAENGSLADIEAFQKRQLKRVVEHAVEHSPFYRDHYRGLSIEDGFALEDLPVMNKRLLMSNFDRVVTDKRLKLDEIEKALEKNPKKQFFLRDYRVITTSGSSGVRGVFVFDREEWAAVLAQSFRTSRMAGAPPLKAMWSKFAWVIADVSVHLSWRLYSSLSPGMPRQLRLKVTQPIEELRDALNAYKPDVLNGYASVIALLAVEQIEGRLNIAPRSVTCFSELLGADKVSLMQEAWGVTPYEHYGAAEAPMIAAECRYHKGLHQFADYCIVEVMDADNRPVAPGEAGKKLLLTNLHKFVQPIIRYEITDMVSWAGRACECGLPFPLLTGVQGRAEDLLVLTDRDGNDVKLPAVLFGAGLSEIGSITEFQVVREGKGMRFCIVPRQGTDRAEVAAKAMETIREVLAARHIEKADFEIDIVDRLDRGKATMGKFKLVL